jgi:predicted MPP superfamily phosphohydrolase
MATYYSGYFMHELLPAKTALLFRQIAGYWIVLFVCSLLIAFISDFLRIVHRFFNIYPQWIFQSYALAKMSLFGMSVIVSSIVLFTGLKNFRDPQVVELSLPVRKHNENHEGLTIVAASDFHLGNIIGTKRLSHWVKLINSQDPDIILFAGDIFDRDFNSNISHEVETELLKLTAKYGVFAVPGNHEYYTDTREVFQCLEGSNITLLIDSVFTLENQLIIAGRDDPTQPERKNMESLLKGLNTDLPLIVMDHQPYSIEESVEHRIDLYLAGHTHNGQIHPLKVFLSRYWNLYYGYRKIESTHFYVTSGLGLRIAPIRIGSQSEIVKINLTAG